MQHSNTSPIGIFDSGIGGLTVAKSVIKALPNEDIIYFGDTARVPYGIKSEETVRSYALQITDFLMRHKVKMILIACNTVSASAKEEIIEAAGDVPVLDVISAGTKAAIDGPKRRHVGVIGTLGTINSKAYVKSVHAIDPTIKVTQKACPLLVPLAEEGWIDNEVARLTLRQYLDVFRITDIESLILGCTHYPLFKQVIPKILNGEGRNIQIIDSADSIAASAKEKLEALDMLNAEGGGFECYVSDRPQRFQELAERFLGHPVKGVHIEQLP
ncbi:MAG: glutamate racemase [Balneolaceae bacterium]|nr:glutamate racemase [Balneolaceae bacterium]